MRNFMQNATILMSGRNWWLFCMPWSLTETWRPRRSRCFIFWLGLALCWAPPVNRGPN